jgi:signal transduction histidine kinase
VIAITHEINEVRALLGARFTIENGAILEADIEEFVAALDNAMSIEDDDPVARISRFEDEVARIRAPLTMTFDDVVAQERANRESLLSAHAIARFGQIGVVVAGAFAATLVIGIIIPAVRRSRSGFADRLTSSRNELFAAADELREPLESIIADTTRLRLGFRDIEQARALDRIAKHASRVNAMLAELLDVTAIQTGATSLRREPLDAACLIDRAVKDHRDEAAVRGVRLRYEAQLSVLVHADRERIRHVLDSLLQIAMRGARAGAELVVHAGAANGEVRFAIIESGPAADEVASQELLLHLCERIVDAHGGRLGIQTSAIGCTYWFTLPVQSSLLR